MMKNGKAVMITYTERGFSLCAAVKAALEGRGYVAELLDGRKNNVSGEMRRIFEKSDVIVFVSACGIAVRMIAPYIKSKAEDPAVLVMDECGNHVISLLSGHLGGANEIAYIISESTGAIPVITTATDVNGKFAVDVWTKKAGCVINDISKIKYVSSAVLRREKVGLTSDFEIEGEIPDELVLMNTGKTGICVSLSGAEKPFDETLNAVPKIVSIGAGCRKGTDSAEFEEFIIRSLQEHDISMKAVENLSTIDIKTDEACMNDFALKYGIRFVTYTAAELNRAGACDSEGNRFKGSDFVRMTTGTDNVCEKSAFLSSDRGKIVIRKHSSSGMTVAAAVRDWKCIF